MGKLILHNLHKVYDAQTVVHNLNLTLDSGEFVTLLGPSGCGKTTTLRMIAGFIKPTVGSITLNDQVLSAPERGINVPPEKRGMGMVFQSYAVWPHMRIFDNVAYPLKLRKLSRAEIGSKVGQALEMVRLTDYVTRYPHELSGGQQQRVALARTLVMEPEVLLLDEPLSNLDAKLREQLRYKIVELQKRLKMTVVYVTHDQLEALAMSDRVVVMNQGRMQQVDTPQGIYTHPANRFVAGFIGIANFIPCTVTRIEGDCAQVVVTAHGAEYPVTAQVNNGLQITSPVLFARPNEIQLSTDGGIPGVLVSQTFLGDRYEVLVSIGSADLRLHRDTPASAAVGESVTLSFTRAVILDGDH